MWAVCDLIYNGERVDYCVEEADCNGCGWCNGVLCGEKAFPGDSLEFLGFPGCSLGFLVSSLFWVLTGSGIGIMPAQWHMVEKNWACSNRLRQSQSP